MFVDNRILVGENEKQKVYIEPKMANRHGLITGATGTGKTTTLKAMAESFSDMGVPVFFSDVKGDLRGLANNYPVCFWDIYGKVGIPVRTTVSEMGPVLLAKLMNLNDTQSDILNVIFKIADDQGLLLVDTKDLKAMLSYGADNNQEFAREYGNISKVSVNTILRNIVSLESKGIDQLFMEPALNISDWFTRDISGKGTINILDCRELIKDSTLYSTFLLWMLSELFETLPEVGDMDKPRMVFFFDEAHLIFKDISKALLEKIEQVVKLIRSKGVGVYFISQSPKDIPDTVIAQLGNKIQHGLRAYTPQDERTVRAVADSFRVNPDLNIYDTILNLGIGEAVVSTLGLDGIPTVTQKVKITAPNTMGLDLSEDELNKRVLTNDLYLKYKDSYDPDSAYEFFERLRKEEAQLKSTQMEEAAKAKEEEKIRKEGIKIAQKRERQVQSGVKKVASSAAGTVGRELGKAVGKSVGGSFGKTLGGNVGAQLFRSILGTFVK